MRDHIIAEIKRLAAASEGKPPGRKAFEAATGIRYHEWYSVHWARWGDALAEAGFAANAMRTKTDADVLLREIAGAYRHFGRVASDGELRLYGRTRPSFPGHNTISSRFRGKANLIAALRAWASKREEFADVLAMLPEDTPTPTQPIERQKDGSVYLIQYGPHYKIGRGSELERRVKQVQIALPEAGTLIHAITTDDPPGIEAYWHRRFADKRMYGEWFKLTPSDVAAFKRRRFQ